MEDRYNGEKVLAIRSDILFEKGVWQGLKTDDLDHLYNLILKNYEFIPRVQAEEDENYKQIIPYVLFKNRDKFFLYEYIKAASETRLHHNYILGVAGHINPIDDGKKDIIEEGMRREWEEEVYYPGNIIDKKFLGVLNDNRREVERVHLGLIYVFVGDQNTLEIREKHKISGKMMTLEEMRPLIGNTDYLGWASLIYPVLNNI